MMLKKLCTFLSLFLVLSSFTWAYASPLTNGLDAYYQKKWVDASLNFKKAIADEPSNSLALVYYIVSNFWGGTSERMIQDIEDQLVDNPNDQLAQVRLGFAYYTQGLVHGRKPDKALSEFRDAARLGPSSLVHAGLGIVYFDMGNFSRSKKELARAMDMNSNDVLPYEYMGRIILSFDNDPQTALNYFQQETRLVPEYPDGHFYLASALDALGKMDEAIGEYEKTIRLDPLGIGRGMDAQIALGDLYDRNKQYDQAKQYYEQALKLDPTNELVKKHLSDLQKEQHESSKPGK